MTNLSSILYIICILLLTQSSSCQQPTPQQLPKLSTAQIWGFGVLAGIGISAIGFLAALVLIIAKKFCNITCFQTLVKFLFSLSCGALVGDAVIHIIAEAYAHTETNNKLVSLVFIVSIFAFLVIDRVLHAVGIAHSHWVGEKCEGDRENHGHHHHHISENNHNHEINNQDLDQDIKKNQHNPEHEHDHNHDHDHHHHDHSHKCHKDNQNASSPNKPHKAQTLSKKQVITSQANLKEEAVESKETQTQKIQRQKQEKKQKRCCHSFSGKDSAGYINIIGSLIHNFIDGLALGVAFATGNPTEIIPVLVAIIAHEIPRQLGDVAILLRSSFTQVQTMLCNGVVNFISLIGVFIGLAVVNMSQVAKTYIMVFVAGNFIYIASDIWQHIMKNKGESAKCGNLLEFFGLSVGIGSMFALTLLESNQHEH